MKRSAQRSANLPKLTSGALLSFSLLLGACSAGAGAPQPDPSPAQPGAAAVLENNPDFALEPAPGFALLEREWGVELDYDTDDLQGVFERYDAHLSAQGFSRESLETDDDGFEAEYRRDSLEVDLDIERDDGRAEVDFDLTDRAPQTGAAFGLNSYAGLGLPDVGAELLEADWDFSTDYDTDDFGAVFAHYDAALAALGWERSDLEQDDDSVEADYRKDGVKLELEVSEDDGEVEADLDLNKALFY